jgi:hypothetical protein
VSKAIRYFSFYRKTRIRANLILVFRQKLASFNVIAITVQLSRFRLKLGYPIKNEMIRIILVTSVMLLVILALSGIVAAVIVSKFDSFDKRAGRNDNE